MTSQLLSTMHKALSDFREKCVALFEFGGPRAGILVYHRVAETSFDPYGLAVSPGHFLQHLRYLKQHYHIVSVEELLEQWSCRSYRDGTVAITFDDGYADNLRTAYPIAKQCEVPITVFVTIQPILRNALFWWDELALYIFQQPVPASLSVVSDSGERCSVHIATVAERRAACEQLHAFLKHMSEDARQRIVATPRFELISDDGKLMVGQPLTMAELKEFAGLPSVSIGAHTMTHPVLRTLSIESQSKEMVSSKRILEELVGESISIVAYPFGKSGDISRDTKRLAAKAGYRAAFTTTGKPVLPSSDPYSLPRLSIHDWPEETFARHLSKLLGRSSRSC